MAEEKQQAALVAFKEATKRLPADDNDEACLRFLRARQYDVNKSVDMYNNYVKWRVEQNVDSVLQEEFAVPKEKWPTAFHGKDKLGRPIFIERTGHFNIKQLIEKDKLTIPQVLRCHIHNQEICGKLYEQYTKEEGKNIETAFTILDLDGCSVWNHLNGYARQFFGEMATIGQNYYPERMGKMIVLNAPRAFPMAWSFIKGFLDTATQNKIEVFSSQAQAKARLLELIDEKYIPKEYGGECDCAANGCFTKIPSFENTEVDSVVSKVADLEVQSKEGEGGADDSQDSVGSKKE